MTPQDYVDWMEDAIASERLQLQSLVGWDYKLCQERIKAYEYALTSFKILSDAAIDKGDEM